VPADLTRATARYKRHAWLAVLGLLLFVTLYLGLACWFTWTAFRCGRDLFSGGHNAFGDVLVGGMSLLLALFLWKALFFVKSGKIGDDIEITAEGQPEVFAYVHALADRARAPRPHRVFLSGRVNAAVFYDLSFINLIFPTRKNLEIGLALVNTLNLSEVSAVLAHELGHFAQRSMAVARWVYMAQQIAGQIVATRDWLDSILRRISYVDFRIAWIGWLLRVIVWSIRSLLDSAFGLVLLAQRALGREMEFQADLVSVSLTGSDALIHALHRLSAADEAWSNAISIAASELSSARAVPDLFTLQSSVIARMAQILDEPGHGASPARATGLRAEHRVFEQALAEPPRMWSTHPANRDREDNAKRVYVAADIDERPAWCLFRNAEQLRKSTTKAMLERAESAAKAQPISDVEALAAVQRKFGRLFFDQRYRGAYLGRSVALPYKKLDDMYGALVPDHALAAGLATLYPEALAADLRSLRLRLEEQNSLEALRDGFLTAPGGVIRHRGRVIQRRQLASVLADVTTEVAAVRSRVEDHDRACRGLHRASARKLGQGWEQYLYGLAATLHYSGHAEANLIDARGHLANVFAIVTADGNVSASERTRLIAACAQVYSALQPIYAQRNDVRLTAAFLERMRPSMSDAPSEKRAASWSELLGDEFQFPYPTSENLASWLQALDSWADCAQHGLDVCERTSLELLLEAEQHVARCVLQDLDPGRAPASSVVPNEYATLAPGEERARQKRLDIWDRFVTADGPGWTAARLAAAGAILVGVLGYGGTFGKSSVAIYNGLGTDVVVTIDGASTELGPFKSHALTLEKTGNIQIETKQRGGALIERFEVPVDAGPRYVYNVAAASPLVEWTASYGAASNVAPTQLGAARWSTSSAAHLFEEPPEKASERTSQRVLSGQGELPSSTLLERVTTEPERQGLIAAHAEWDDVTAPFAKGWVERAMSLPQAERIMQSRLSRNPRDVLALRAQQDIVKPEAKAEVCATQTRAALARPGDLDLQYLRVRCLDEGKARSDAFLEGYRAHPEHGFFAVAAGYELAERKQWDEALLAMGAGVDRFGALSETVRVDQARVLRLLGRWNAESYPGWLTQSPLLATLLALESGQDVDGPAVAFFQLAKGQLDAALATAAHPSPLHPRILRLVAASEGASTTQIDGALYLPDSAGIDDYTIWPSLALAARQKQQHDALDAKAREMSKDLAERATSLLQHKAALDEAAIERAAAGLSPLERGKLLTFALVLAGEAAPATVREQAKALLFAPERPYFR
jgi:Zn-dependent protease with chaperone function